MTVRRLGTNMRRRHYSANPLIPASLLLAIIGGSGSLWAGDSLTLTDKGSSVVLHNALATAEVDKSSGMVTSLHCNDGVNLVRNIYMHPDFMTGPADGYRVVQQTDTLLDICFLFLRRAEGEDPLTAKGHRIELHLAMRPDTPGLYAYFVWNVTAGPDVRNYKTLNRTGVSKYRIITLDTPYYYTDEEHNGVYPMHGLEQKRTVYNATWLFDDGTIHSKYDDLSLQYRERLLGKFNDTHGIFFITASNEWIGGGPFKQRVCQEGDHLLFMHLLDGHLGLPAEDPVLAEGWEHVFGPWLIYVDHAADKAQVLAQAQAQAAREIPKWPYDWVPAPAYAAQGRVTVRGQLRLTDGTSPEGAFIILGDRGMHYQQRAQNYLYYRQADRDGRFAIPGVRPGEFKMYAFVKGVLGEYVQDAVTVAPGRDNDLGEIRWTPETFGETLWQIGAPDRTGEEFWMGQYQRQWGMHIIYPKFFPHDVDFYIGKSHEDQDWPYYQLTARTWDRIEDYNRGYYWDDSIHRLRFDFAKDQPADPTDRTQFDPYTPAPYRIHFTLDKQYQDQATLSLAVAGTMFEGPTLVLVNGQDVTGGQPIRFADSATLRRCTGIGVYDLKRVSFDATLLRRGENTITLVAPKFATTKGRLPKQVIGDVVYDCIRLEAIPR